MHQHAITDQEFGLFQRLIFKIAGISLSEAKKVLLVGRLQKRLRHYQLDTFSEYYRMLSSGEHPEELQTMVDLLTTNETYFFREPQHFEFLRDQILPKHRGGDLFRVWSAASSTGEEPYTLAMLLAEHLPSTPWEIVGSDLSTRVLERARRGHYPIERNEGIPRKFLEKYCLKGVRSQDGTFLISQKLRDRVTFHHVNLTLPIDKKVGMFDVIFLRNVMIYFNMETKGKVIANLLPQLKPGGYLIIGHSETLSGLSTPLTPVLPTIYRKL